MNGRTALTWQDVAAFAQATGKIEPGWELQTLFDMSRAYLDGLTNGEKPLGAPPYERPSQ